MIKEQPVSKSYKYSVGERVKCNDGWLVVTSLQDNYKIGVLFDDGCITSTTHHRLHLRNIKSYMFPRLKGVGFLGGTRHKASIGGKATRTYTTWSNMIQRCYCPNKQALQPYYKGCTVSREWHNFQNFAGWYQANYIRGYHLDKDIKVTGNKIYSRHTCLFVTAKENSSAAIAKLYEFTDPNGVDIEVHNLYDFCLRHGLMHSSMHALHCGRIKSHKKYTKKVK